MNAAEIVLGSRRRMSRVIAIEGAHTTMASNPNVQRVVAARLALS